MTTDDGQERLTEWAEMPFPSKAKSDRIDMPHIALYKHHWPSDTCSILCASTVIS